MRRVKQSLKANRDDGRSLQHRLATYLLTYRSTPHATTGVVAPCTLFLNRKIRTRFDLLRPYQERRVTEQQAKQKEHTDRHSRERDRVMACDLRPGPDWIPAVVTEILGLSHI